MRSEASVRSANPLGALLQEWRRRRQMSQLALSTRAGISTRHLCFVETGRARASREMVLLLAAALDVPLREQNAFLLAAGFAPVYLETDLDAPELAPARAALDAILRHQEPHPAVVLDRHWDILRTNGAAERLFGWLLASRKAIAGRPNILRFLFHPEGLRASVIGWEQLASHLVHRVQRELVGTSDAGRTRALLDELLAYPGVPESLRRTNVSRPLSPVLPVVFEKDATRFEYFSTVTTLGTPQDVTLQEIRIECLFPMNEATTRNAQKLASST